MDLSGVAETVTRARDEVTAVHRHPANRRSWPVTKAEASGRGPRPGWTAAAPRCLTTGGWTTRVGPRGTRRPAA